ncbi:hypothetical protein PTW37_09615 [Arthrobacter agilis]|uniref:hypothetical protein n=1 Tax=Arthrobacter agilis TaxID=37921 RepID=UPI0023654E0E|nr:hypothetical protein [Arthrobacter agilis]WDF32137.1 hypothetical protein PTW37_09615 [Arthrobacter agilis]
METTIPDELAALDIHLKPIHGPRRPKPLIGVVLPAGAATELEVAATVASLLTSVCQDYVVDIAGAPPIWVRLRRWLAEDTRFRWVTDRVTAPRAATYTLVVPAGTRLGAFSLEALVDAMQNDRISCLRALVDGRAGAAEFWDTAVLTGLWETGDPEAAVRRRGGERWIAGNALGLHDYRAPAPRVHLRRGAAGRHEVTVVVRDAGDPAVRRDYEDRIRGLEARVARSEVAGRRFETGIAPARGITRVKAVLKRGPGYTVARVGSLVTGRLRK